MIPAWLIYDEIGAARNRDYIELHKKIGRQYDMDFSLRIVPNQSEIKTFLSESGLPVFALVRTIRPELSGKLEECGVPVFNPSFVSRICNDKGSTIAYIKEKTTVPTVPTKRFFHSQFSPELLAEYPSHVIKSVCGHGGSQVFLTDDNIENIRAGLKKDDFVIQPWIKVRGKDVRVYVIGKKVIAAIERTSKDDFRANYSLGGTVRSIGLGDEILEFVHQICEVFDFGLAGIDFLIDDRGNWLLNEIEDVVGARMLYQCQPDIHLLEQYFCYIHDKILQYR